MFDSNSILLDTYHSGKTAGYGWPHIVDDLYYTTADYLYDLGFTVTLTDKPLTDYHLERFSLIIVSGPSLDFSEEELNRISYYVSSGGSLLMTVDTEFYYNSTQINDVASLFDIEFGGRFQADNAWIVNKDTPIGSQILQGITEPPIHTYGRFVALDGVPLIYPDSATVLIKFDGINHNNKVHYSDIAALIALEFGAGKILAGPYDGVMQPWIPADTDNQNPIFLNAISWLTNNPVSDTVLENPSPVGVTDRVLANAIIDTREKIRDIEESLGNLEVPDADLLEVFNTSMNVLQDELGELKVSTLDTLNDNENSLINLENSVNELKSTNTILENSVNELKSTNTILSVISIISIIMIIVLLGIVIKSSLNK
jgi:hypothetical protein